MSDRSIANCLKRMIKGGFFQRPRTVPHIHTFVRDAGLPVKLRQVEDVLATLEKSGALERRTHTRTAYFLPRLQTSGKQAEEAAHEQQCQP